MSGTTQARVAHIGAFNGRNTGDTAILTAMHQLFAGLANFAWHTYDCQSTAFTEERVEELNDFDLIIVGGGGLLWNRPENRSVSGWQWNIETRLIERIRPPLVVYGVGWTQFPYGDRTDQHPEIWTSLRALLERADLFSVRNRGTYRMLEKRLCPSASHIIPDPAYFLRPNTCSYPIPSDRQVALCWATDRPDWRWRTPDHAARTSAAVSRYCSLGVDHLGGPSRFYATPGQLAEFYGRMDLVLGMRKHSLILPLGRGTPVIGLGDMQEVRWVLEDAGLDEWLIDSTTPERTIRDLIERALAGDQPAPDLAGMRARLDAFNRRVLALVPQRRDVA